MRIIGSIFCTFGVVPVSSMTQSTKFFFKVRKKKYCKQIAPQLFACWVIFHGFVVICWLFFKKFFQVHYQSVKPFGSCSGLIMGGSRGGTGDPTPPPPPPPWKFAKIKGFLAILAQITWKITKLPSRHSMLGILRPASKMPFKWGFAGGPTMARWSWYLFGSSPLLKKKKSCQSWTPSDKNFWIRVCWWS